MAHYYMFNFGKQPQLPTVLLIDDDMVSREVTATVLTMGGYTVHTAEHGAAALELLDAGECAPGVILMDTQMPGLSGTALLERLRERSQATIYCISASNAPDELIATSDGFLLKPFDAGALGHLLEMREAQAGTPASSQPEPAGDPVVSAATLAQLRGLMSPAAVKEIYAAVIADLAARLDSLEAAVAAGNTDEVRRIGHAIKGGCGMAGAMQAARLGARFESGGDQLDDCALSLDELRAALSNLERMLETEFPA